MKDKEIEKEIDERLTDYANSFPPFKIIEKEKESEMECDVKTLSVSLINELDKLTSEQIKQLLDVLEHGMVVKSPSFIKSDFFPKRK